ncbi:unnamed protein product [Caenorhabditis auriculariae]|uniref:TIL domain-containing protein n=1 Tax=Caenorhabditis auriculariae TaxID=2777116 RepID=A0A8S1GTM1_9PELO|nr:unnamed protein product [Caenorhabditis auriculariae]
MRIKASVIIFAFCIQTTSAGFCNEPNEEFYDCTGSDTCEPTCFGIPDTCNKECRVCACKSGYIRHYGICINISDCPTPRSKREVCPPNESFDACGTRCPETCAKQGPRTCVKVCHAACFCNDGYIREFEGGRVFSRKVKHQAFAELIHLFFNSSPLSSYPAKKLRRTLSRMFNMMSKITIVIFFSCLPASFCLSVPEQPPNRTEVPLPGPCERFSCRKGTVCILKKKYDDCSKNCELITACVPPTQKPKTCGQNEDLKSCGSACEPTCNQTRYSCTLLCIVNVCQCKSGFVRSHGKCIPKAECPKIVKRETCGPNETFNTCGTKCPSTCDHKGPRPCIKMCNPACECNEGYIREFEGGKCIPRRSCPRKNVGSCARVKCSPGDQCVDGKCYSGPSCLTAKCSAGFECQMVDVVCIRAPCLKVPTCVPSPRK